MPKCRQCNTGFVIENWDRQHYAKMQVSDPTLCPNCRQQRRLAWRNERNWYRHPCARCAKSIVSLFDTDSPYTIYCQECFWGDAWDATDYGRDFDFSRPFFEQWRELQLKVPRLCLLNIHSENSEYTNHSANNRNCYMGVAMGKCEDCLYGHWVLWSRNVVDALYTDKSQQCYELIYCINCHETFFSEYCEAMSSSWFCFECKGLENCIGCTQLQHKKFHVFNQPVSEAEFHRIKEEMLSDPQKFQEIRQKFEALKAKAPRRAMRQINCINSIGNDLINCKNAKYCFNAHDLEDCKYVFDAANNKDCIDNYEHGWLVPSELIYECHAGMAGFNLRFCHLCADSRNLTYCDSCLNNSSDLFGCVALKHKSYCILNKQYTRDEYAKLVPRIVEHMKKTEEWGEFFLASMSPFAYNETAAPEYYPLSKEQILACGWRWKDNIDKPPSVTKVIPAERLPDRIEDVPDDVLNWAIQCQATGRLFRIISQELKFYRQHRLPVPRLHPDERHHRRMRLRPSRKLYERTCNQCNAAIQSVYSPEDPLIVYCEACYLKALY